MGFNEAVGARLGKKREAKARKLVAPHLEDSEEFLGWYIGLKVGTLSSRAGANPQIRGAAGGNVVGAWKPFDLAGRSDKCLFERVEWWESSMAVVLTNLGLHSLSVNPATGKLKDYDRRWLPVEDVLAISETGLRVRTGVTTLTVGAIVGGHTIVPEKHREALERDLQGRYFEVPKDSEAAFQSLSERFAALR